MNNEDLVMLKHLFDSFDSNSDRYLSKGEFVAFSHEVLKILDRGGSNEAFKVSDLNHDDRISFEEFCRISL